MTPFVWRLRLPHVSLLHPALGVLHNRGAHRLYLSLLHSRNSSKLQRNQRTIVVTISIRPKGLAQRQETVAYGKLAASGLGTAGCASDDSVTGRARRRCFAGDLVEQVWVLVHGVGGELAAGGISEGVVVVEVVDTGTGGVGGERHHDSGATGAAALDGVLSGGGAGGNVVEVEGCWGGRRREHCGGGGGDSRCGGSECRSSLDCLVLKSIRVRFTFRVWRNFLHQCTGSRLAGKSRWRLRWCMRLRLELQ